MVWIDESSTVGHFGKFTYRAAWRTHTFAKTMGSIVKCSTV